MHTRARRQATRWLTVVLFMLPALLLFCLLVLAPILIAGYASFFDWNGFGPPTDFVGLGNFQRLLDDPIFLDDLWHGFLIISLTLVFQLPAALGLAMLLNQRLRGRRFYRLVFFAPYVLSEVITGVLFSMIFSPESGLVNHLLGSVGLDSLAIAWLAEPSIVMYTVFLVISWKYFGFHMILYLAGRQGIPEEVIEAAAIDGAGHWQTFRHVTLPLLGPTIRISVFLAIIGTVQLFDMVYVLTGGGPVHSSETLAISMFQVGFRQFEVGYASAISIAMFLISLVFGLIYQRYVIRRDVEGAITVMGGRR
ncbi:sugar ABC transporter permease [Solwaraspora sp. WMMD1047]|uniref:carbohydrate ABC transporter permease n=1 Tax=Solwaraspora sp. WMMD1047 TaxID=3016102 RepID=UPI0024161CEA|nr:sugar ABC transporter permease [Solwaraspora sp. WMMD1047]MDG4832858.1 sugar ABC transporter permease [Solwaraspora sp. WMMD1047]